MLSSGAEVSSAELRLLLVDDDVGMQTSFRRILKLDGYHVDVAGSAAEARDRDNWSDYFAILLDRRLPDGSADELLPELKQRAPDAAVLVVTGFADVQSSIAALRAGADDYLLKPVEPESLRARLRQIADLNQLRREQQRTEVKLRESESRFRQLADNIDAVFWLRDGDGLLYVSPAFEQIYGLTRESFIKDPTALNSLIHPDDLERVRENIQRPASKASEYEYRIVRDDGGERWIQTRVFPFLGEESGLRWAEISVDRTTEILAARELQQERDFANSLVDTAHAIVLVLDADAKVIQFNRFAERLTGYSIEDARGADWFTEFLPERERSRIQLVFDRAIKGEPVEGVVNSINTRTGERDITWFARALRDDSGTITGVLAIGHDITDLRDAQRQLVQSERLAAIGQMVTGLAHESRNALQRARAALDMLTLDLEGQTEQLDLSERIKRALADLQRLYEEVKNYAAPIQLERAVEDIAKIWRRVWQDVSEASQRSLALTESIDGVALIARVDPYRLEQVFRNIMENAVAACGDEGCVNVACCIEEQNETASLRISFQDDGPGIDEDTAAKVFQPFFTTRQRGTGLGMPIAKRIVEAHGGQISICGMKTGGTEVIVKLPKCAS